MPSVLVIDSLQRVRPVDPALMNAAPLAKVTAVLPEEKRDSVDALGLLAAPRPPLAPDGVDLALLRSAIRAEHKVLIAYGDEAGRRTERRIWPIALTFYERTRILAAWCELRHGFRHFRTDRIAAAAATAERYPRRRRLLMKEWRGAEGIAELD